MKHLGLFAAGVLFGTAGLKILSSKDAKKVYSHTTAAVLRAKDCVMQAVTNVREDAEDVYADAKDINERRAAEEDAEVIADASEEKRTRNNRRRAATRGSLSLSEELIHYEMQNSARIRRAHTRASELPPHDAASGGRSGILSAQCGRRARGLGL